MVDTVRTLPALQTLLADNSSGDISAQDVRDFLVSVFPPQYVGARISDPSGADQPLSANTRALVTFDTEDYDSDGFADLGSNNERLTIPTGMGGLYSFGGALAFDQAVGEWFEAGIAINGLGGTLLFINKTEVSTGQEGQVTTSGSAVLSAGDYVSLAARSESGGDVKHQPYAPMLWLVYHGQAPA